MTTNQQSPRILRKHLGLNQNQFWERVGISQSGGCRYESGRTIPKPVSELVRLNHQLQVDTSGITEANAEAIRLILSGAVAPTAVIGLAQREAA